MSVGSYIIEVLCDRKGFDDWWDNLDDDIRQEIIDELDGKVGTGPVLPLAPWGRV
jgi:hypothetical protein